MELLQELIMGIISVWIGYCIGVRTKKLKHHWKCMGDKCEFSVSSTHANFVQELMNQHLEEKHPNGY